MHWLASELVRVGVDARLLLIGAGGPYFGANEALLAPAADRLYSQVTDPNEARGAVLIYPEIVHDHPLAQWSPAGVVRYFLNADGAVAGRKVEAGPNDLLLGYSPAFGDFDHYLFFPSFYRAETYGSVPVHSGHRDRVIAYGGKGGSARVPPTIAGDVTVFTRSWPSDPVVFVGLLRQSKYFYTADPLSAINFEALLCGCIPVVTTWNGQDPDRLARFDLPSVHELWQGSITVERAEQARLDLLADLAAWRRKWPDTLRDFTRLLAGRFGGEP